MTDHITWESCPRCGDRAAVGWVSAPSAGGERSGRLPEEFDCISGCRLTDHELFRIFGAGGRHG